MSFSLSNELKSSSDINVRSIGILRCSIILLGFLISLIGLNDRFKILPAGEIILNVISISTGLAAILSYVGSCQNIVVQEQIQDYLSAMQESAQHYETGALAASFKHDRIKRRAYLRRASYLFLSSLLLCGSLAIEPFATRFEWSTWWHSLDWSLETVLPAIAFGCPIFFLFCGEIGSLVKHKGNAAER